jgi:hypothetical protein
VAFFILEISNYQSKTLKTLEKMPSLSFFASEVTEVLLGAATRLRNADFLRRVNLTIPEAFGEAYTLVLQGLLVQSGTIKKRSKS